jgi:hypothetical protein
LVNTHHFFSFDHLFLTHSSDLGAYQQPAREALSTLQDVTVTGVGKKIICFDYFRRFFCIRYPLKYSLKISSTM